MFSLPVMNVEIIHDNVRIRCTGNVNGMRTYDSGEYVIAECGMKSLADCFECLEHNARDYAARHGANVTVAIKQVSTTEFSRILG